MRKFLVSSLIAFSFSAHGAPVYEGALETAQPQHAPNAKIKFRVHAKGDEWNNWYEDDRGYSVIRHQKTGVWHYAQRNAQGKLEAHQGIVGRDDPEAWGLKKHQHEDEKHENQHRHPDRHRKAAAASGAPLMAAATLPASNIPVFQVTQAVPTLFILASFSNRAGTYLASDFANLLNNQLASYFNEASFNQMQLTPALESNGTLNDGIIGWLNLNIAHPNTAGALNDQNRTLTKLAIQAADPYINYASYDSNQDGWVDSKELAIVIIPAGYETAYGGASFAKTPSIWGHTWALGGTGPAPTVDGVIVGDTHNGLGGYCQFGEIQGTTYANDDHQATIGVMAHELGHLIMQWYDLYDTDGSSSGLGNWSLMAAGAWSKKASDTYQGMTPVHPDPWSKLKAGWVSPVIDFIGSLTLNAISSNTASASNSVYLQTTTDANQYFLFENRGQYGFDQGLNSIGNNTGGIAVYHVDETMPDNNNEAHKLVDLEEADNDTGMDRGLNEGLPSHLFYSGNKTVFDDTTSPNTRLYNGTATNIALNSVSASQQAMTAVFSPRTASYSLSISKVGSGTVSSTPAGINCGTSCNASFSAGTNITLTATPATGYTFTGWSGGCSGSLSTCSINLNASQSVVASFQAIPATTYPLNITVSGPGSVSAKANQYTTITCTTACTTSYKSGTSVQLTATATKGRKFTGWSGACTGTKTCTVSMTASKSVTASFK